MAPIAAVIALSVAPVLQPFGASEGDLVRTTVMTDRDRIAPGDTFTVALEFKISPHWHIYWDGLNDTGVPTRISLEAPRGFEVGEFRWPAPTLHELDGGLLDYVLEDRVVALAEVRAPDDVTVGSVVELRGRARWLVCQETCIPGDANFSLALTVGGTAIPSRHASMVEEAATRLPVALPNAKSEVKVRILYEKTAMWASADGATDIRFYPKSTCVPMPDRRARQKSKDGWFGFEFEDSVENGRGVWGVLEIRNDDQESPRWYLIAPETEAADDARE
ncbi:MAG: hypothetical protein H6811_10220 [Phycisphaeraceae bacterium]|nr:hypothetical protein [Phycisphaeraceae bacterium]